jgi:hypothetical protein
MQAALRDVVGRCLFGVDIKAMAVELCKVSLWMEALDPGRPLSFLDAHIQSGNALLGVSPALLKRGLPEKAFAGVLPGDDPDTMKALRKRDRDERKGNVKTLELFASQAPDASLASAHNTVLRDHATRVDQADDGDLSAFETKRSQFTAWQGLARTAQRRPPRRPLVRHPGLAQTARPPRRHPDHCRVDPPAQTPGANRSERKYRRRAAPPAIQLLSLAPALPPGLQAVARPPGRNRQGRLRLGRRLRRHPGQPALGARETAGERVLRRARPEHRQRR